VVACLHAETDLVKIRKYCRARVPARLRHQIRVEAADRGNSVTIFDCHPPWHPNNSPVNRR